MSKLTNRTASPTLTRRLISDLLASGYTWEEITEKSGIYPEEVSNNNRRIEADKHYRLLRLLNETHNLDWFLDQSDFKLNLLFNRDNILDSLADDSTNYCLLSLNSKNLKQALVHYVMYRSIIANVDRLSIQDIENGLTIAYFHEYPDINYQFVPMINFLFVISIIENYTDDVSSYCIKTTSEPNNTLAKIYKYWNCEIEWQSQINSLSFTSMHLETDYRQFNEVVYKILLKKVKAEYDELSMDESIQTLVEETIKEIIHSSLLDFKSSLATLRVCNHLGISKTTLARRLKDEDTSYRAIEKKIKLEEGINLLKNTTMPVGNISLKLGFSNQAAFNRFFNDAMNISPLKFRKH